MSAIQPFNRERAIQTIGLSGTVLTAILDAAGNNEGQIREYIYNQLTEAGRRVTREVNLAVNRLSRDPQGLRQSLRSSQQNQLSESNTNNQLNRQQEARRETTNLRRERHAMEAEDTNMNPTAPVAEAAMSSMANGKNRRDTPITPLPSHIAIGIPEVFTMKHLSEKTILARCPNTSKFSTMQYTEFPDDTNPTFNSIDPFQIQTNSVYDPFISIAGEQKPTWYEWAKTYWRYYTVLGCEYQITITYIGDGTRDFPYPTDTIFDHNQFTVLMTNATTPPAPSNWTHEDFRKVRGADNKIITPNSTRSAVIQFSDFLTSGDDVREIEQDGNDKLWTAAGQSPDWKQYLNLYCRRMPTYASTRNPTYYRIDFHLKQTVQWKDLNSTYKWKYEP